MTATYFRIYDLPWTPSETEERRFRRVVGAAVGLFVAFGIIVPFLPAPPRPLVAPAIPERIVEFLIEQPRPKPPPKVELPRPVPEPRPVVDAPEPAREAVPTPKAAPDPRARAASSGLLALSRELAELRDIDVAAEVETESMTAEAGDRTSVNRGILAAKTGEGSGGIAVAASGGVGGGQLRGLKGVATAKVSSGVEAGNAAESQRTGRSGKAARTREEVELVFDRNKSAIHALYSRALRDNPALQGKVVLEVTIAPSGEVTDCRIVSSDLGDADLERKLVARVKMFRFEARDVAPMTTTKPIEFFPA
jgi:TonB family protein